MKQAIPAILFLASVLPSPADDSAYRTAIDSAHERFRILEVELHDYRKVVPALPPAQEEERHRLLGQLIADDPVWALAEEIQADISALAAIRQRSPADSDILESLKDLLAITSGFQGRATTRAQAEQFATALRQFVARRDALGASTWAKSQ
jgi:hypothetical protein